MTCGIDCFSFKEQLYTRQQQLHESTIQYYHDVMRLCSKVDLNMDNDTRLKHLYRGLRRETKITVDIQKLNTPNEFLQELARLEQLQKDFQTEDQEPLVTIMPQNQYPKFHQQHQQPYPQRLQPQHNSYTQSRLRSRRYPSYQYQSSPQYRNQQSASSKYDNPHLNRW